MTEVQSCVARPSFYDSLFSEFKTGRYELTCEWLICLAKLNHHRPQYNKNGVCICEHCGHLTWYRVVFKSPFDCEDDIDNFNNDFEDEIVANGSTRTDIDRQDDEWGVAFRTPQDHEGVMEILHTLADDNSIKILEVKYIRPDKSESALFTKENFKSMTKIYDGDEDKVTDKRIKLTRLVYNTDSDIVQKTYDRNLFVAMCDFQGILM